MPRCRTRRSTSPTTTSPIYGRAQELAGGNLSAAIATALRRYVDVEEGRREGFDEIIVRVGPGHRAGRSASPASSSASGSARRRAASSTSASTGAARASSSSTSSGRRTSRCVDAEGKPAGWRGHLGLGDVSYGSPARRVDARDRRDARRLREKVPPQLFDIVAGMAESSRRSKTSTSDALHRASTGCCRTPGRVRR